MMRHCPYSCSCMEMEPIHLCQRDCGMSSSLAKNPCPSCVLGIKISRVLQHIVTILCHLLLKYPGNYDNMWLIKQGSVGADYRVSLREQFRLGDIRGQHLGEKQVDARLTTPCLSPGKIWSRVEATIISHTGWFSWAVHSSSRWACPFHGATGMRA